MLSDKSNPIDMMDIEFEDDGNYKSCFARSMVVNSHHYHQSKNSKQLQKNENTSVGDSITNKGGSISNNKPTPAYLDTSMSSFSLRRDCFYPILSSGDSLRSNRSSAITQDNSRRSSACSSRIAEMPVENLVLKSQIETLQWQLKQTEASREMYRAVMQQVVTFLERAHRNLQILGSRVTNNTRQQKTVLRSQSDYSMIKSKENLDLSKLSIETPTDYTAFRDFTWRRQKKLETSQEEIPPEKLSQEAFRLLRTAQSLLNTRAPDLAHLDNSEDVTFLEQIDKEFPKPRETSSLQLPTLSSSSDKDVRISTAFNRKLSLQQHKRNSLRIEPPKKKSNNECYILSSTLNGAFNNEFVSSIYSHKSLSLEHKKSFKLEPEISNSPPVSSVSSAEDESGFSSMNSFQELGIPLISPLVAEEKTKKEALLKSMLQETSADDPLTEKETSIKQKDVKLWQRPSAIVNNKRSSFVPVENSELVEKQSLKVLWV